MMRSATSAGVRVIAIASALISVGCHRAPQPTSVPPRLRIGVGLGPSVRANAVSSLGSLLYAESLFTREPDGRVLARLVTGWQWENDGCTLRLHLKRNVRLHDGATLTAAMVAANIRKLRDDALGLEYATDVSTPDDATVVISLGQPDSFLLPELTGLRIVAPGGPDIGTGPFKVVSKTPSFETVAFDQYHGGKPAVSGVSIVLYPTQRGAWAALMRNEVDAVQEVSRETVEFAASNVQTFPSLQPYYVPLLLNHQHPALSRVEVRRALNEAIDAEAIVRSAMRGHGRVAADPIWPLHWAYDASGGRAAHAVDSATRRLDAAGLPLPAVAKPDGTRFRMTLRCLFWSEDSQYERIALMVQRQLLDVGVYLTLTPADMTTIGKQIKSGDFDTVLMRVNSGRSLDYTYRFWHSNRSDSLIAGYTGVDGLLDDLRQSTTDTQARAAIRGLARTFHEDVPAVFIAWTQATRAIDTRFTVGEGNSQDPLVNIGQWRPAGPVDK